LLYGALAWGRLLWWFAAFYHVRKVYKLLSKRRIPRSAEADRRIVRNKLMCSSLRYNTPVTVHVFPSLTITSNGTDHGMLRFFGYPLKYLLMPLAYRQAVEDLRRIHCSY